ncbi:exodeoxyribonuclease VII small subunit [Listeria costaricensis]|uniref:exodeoxyribonuclease VII small subunit n=1 Tax=Listeria costaricensis TaxID=2026604 RepID=UPI000C07FBD5|nr:exodeoxyribonuclease VII small subunit [Listeria costaricensis]
MAAKKQTFEEAMSELEKIVEALESGEATLEESLDLYQKGVKLTKICQEKLQAAEEKMAKVVDEMDTETPFDVGGE